MSSADAVFRDRLAPQNLDAEKSVLGSMLRANRVIGDIIAILKKDDFYTDAHQKIYETIVQHNSLGGQAVDLVILAEQLKLRGWLEDAGGYTYLANLWDAAPTAANAEYYARIVRDKSLVRSLIDAGTEILATAYNQNAPAEQLIEKAAGTIFEMASKGLGGSLTTLEEAIDATYDRIDKRTTGAEMSHSGLSTGFTELNELTAGLQQGELIIIAARPSVGKTAFSLGLTRNVLLHEKAPVFFVSLEQSRIEIAERLLCAQAKVDSHRLRKGTLTSDDMEKLILAGSELRSTPLIIDDSPQQGMLRIAANARRLKYQKDIKLVVIDYLQLIEPENRRDPRQEQVAQISRRLKFLARELNIPVIALAQVNRASEDRQDHRPRLSDLRESGSIEQDADTVFMLHRPDRFEPGQHEGIIEVIVAKQRNGPTGEVTLAYIKQYLSYEDFKVASPFES
ncbi:MAG: replicative DNA helicase [Planctomycetia bacterium]|nr:replicative DNA helicase [Planctomycetia bacterium]